MMGLSTTHQGGALTMKFKQTDAQNQRIEQITTSHLVLGIDMAKETHVAQATNFRGIVVSKRHLSFSNSMEGFEKNETLDDGVTAKTPIKEAHHRHGADRPLLV